MSAAWTQKWMALLCPPPLLFHTPPQNNTNNTHQPNLLKFSGLVYEAGEAEAGRTKVEDKARAMPGADLKKACDLLGAFPPPPFLVMCVCMDGGERGGEGKGRGLGWLGSPVVLSPCLLTPIHPPSKNPQTQTHQANTHLTLHPPQTKPNQNPKQKA